MAIRLAVRGYSGRSLVFEERIEAERDEDLEPLAKAQILRIVKYPKNMIEIEFLDEPDVNQRFFRFGNDPAGMVMPIALERWREEK